MQEKPEWNYTEICIGNVKSLLNTHDVEVESPDGYVEVLDYIEKGYHKQYVLVSSRGEIIKCSGGHLFETDIGWVSAKAIADNEICVNVLHDDGEFYRATCVATNTEIPIVDISVNHDNRRYYTNGVSSHNTGVGKSLVMCHMAAASFAHGKNVLYITAEMAEERIAERIDANLLDVTLDELKALPRNTFQKKIERIKDKSPGRLVIKEYPTGVAHAGHFRHLLNELRLKKNFVPDIIFIDYLNICSSSRIKGAASANTYVLVKSIAEEIRGLAMEFNVPIVTATQANREGYGSGDMDLTNTSESIGLPQTVDAMFALISTEELESMGQIMIKQLKNRWNDLSYYRRFVVGIDRSKMRLYEVEEHAQGNVYNEVPSKNDSNEFKFNKSAKKKLTAEGLK
jgi:hypothetical protein